MKLKRIDKKIEEYLMNIAETDRIDVENNEEESESKKYILSGTGQEKKCQTRVSAPNTD